MSIILSDKSVFMTLVVLRLSRISSISSLVRSNADKISDSVFPELLWEIPFRFSSDRMRDRNKKVDQNSEIL